MKYVIVLLLPVMLLAGCKKDGTPVKETLLSKILVNGQVAYRAYYSGQNQLITFESYDTDPAHNLMFGYSKIAYDNQNRLQEMTYFNMPGNIPVDKGFFEYDNAGRITVEKIYDLQGPNPSVPSSTVTFSYNSQGQMTNYTQKDKNGKLENYLNYTYFLQGFVKDETEYDENSNHQLVMTGKTIYSIPGSAFPKGWEKFRIIPAEHVTAIGLYDVEQHYSYSAIGVITSNWSENKSAREFNPDGTLKTEVHTIKYIMPVAADNVQTVSYEYITQ